MDFNLIFFTILMLARRIMLKINQYFYVQLSQTSFMALIGLKLMPIVIFLVSNYFLMRILLTGNLFNLICTLFTVLLSTVVFGLHPTLISLNNTLSVNQVDQFKDIGKDKKDDSKKEEPKKEIKTKVKSSKSKKKSSQSETVEEQD